MRAAQRPRQSMHVGPRPRPVRRAVPRVRARVQEGAAASVPAVAAPVTLALVGVVPSGTVVWTGARLTGGTCRVVVVLVRVLDGARVGVEDAAAQLLTALEAPRAAAAEGVPVGVAEEPALVAAADHELAAVVLETVSFTVRALASGHCCQ
jgi:hypothetical protein